MPDPIKFLYITCENCAHKNKVHIDTCSLIKNCEVCETELDMTRIIDLRSQTPRGCDGTLDLF